MYHQNRVIAEKLGVHKASRTVAEFSTPKVHDPENFILLLTPVNPVEVFHLLAQTIQNFQRR